MTKTHLLLLLIISCIGLVACQNLQVRPTATVSIGHGL
jgi:hypothetical protein